MSSINFNGQPGGFQPTLGHDRTVPFTSPLLTPVSTADPQAALVQISALLALLDVISSDLEDKLSTFALPITDTAADALLLAAQKTQWPSDLGEPKKYITYGYYKALLQTDTAAAAYIRSRYLAAAQDITGTNAIDLVPLVDDIRQETLLAQEFISQNVTTLGDSSEYRAVENLQNWITTAFGDAGAIRSIFEEGDTPAQLPDSDINSLDAQSASNAQALFKVNLNKLNADLNQALAALKTNFSNYAATFYNNFLTPAINFRQNVTSQLTPIYPGIIGQEMVAAHNAVDNHLASLLADQLRRANMFDQAMTNIENIIMNRDKYRSYIQQLSALGTSVSTGASGTMISATDTPTEASFFSAGTQSATPNFSASHSALADILDPTAHTQYILKGGDIITGDILLASGVSIDHVVPSAHAHTGQDGSAKIDGANITSGTISMSAVNTHEVPPAPHNVRVVNVTAGTSVVTVLLAWDGDDSLTYEVQYAPIV